MYHLIFTRSLYNLLLAGFLFILTGAFAAQAQPGVADLSFNPDDAGFGTGVGASSTVRTVVAQEDGKVLIGGAFTTYHGIARGRIARLLPNGNLDTGFNSGTGANGDVRAIAEQPDGKLIIAGNFTSWNGTARVRIARLHSDGTLDTSFDPGAGANGLVHTVKLLANGTILIGGAFTTINNTERNYIARLLPDGTPDTSFDPGTGASGIIHTATVQPDGKIIIGGVFIAYNGTAINRIARLEASGTLDASFNPGTGASGIVYAAKVQADGKIVIGGAFTTVNGTARARIARLNTDGSIDAAFFPGTGASATVQAVAVQSDGKISIGGEFLTFNGTARSRIARLQPDGRLDTSFDPGAGAGGIVYSIDLQQDDKAIIGGTFTTYNETVKNRIARLNPDGSLDEEFDPGAGANGIVYATAADGWRRILIGGAFTSYNGTPVSRIARLSAHGRIDNTFTPGAGANGDVRAIVVLPGDKVLIGGSFTTYRGASRNYIARLNTDGTLDTGFDPGAGANGVIHSVVVQDDHRILIGGAFTSYNGTARNRIARLNPDGTLDTSFDPGTGASGIVYAVALQPDGKILTGGAFTAYNGTARNRIARLNADGSLDSGFTPGSGASADVRTVALEPSSKIILGGNFTTYNGTARNRIARINTDGSLDTGFLPGAGAGAIVHTSMLQADGKVYIGGDFTTYDGTSRVRFARLNPDGSLDTGFDTRTGANGIVHSITNQLDSMIVIGGAFTSYDGTGRNRVGRVFAEIYPLSAGTGPEAVPDVQVYPNPGSGDFFIVSSGPFTSEPVTLTLYNVTGVQVLTRQVKAEEARAGINLQTDTLKSGVYYLRISTRGHAVTRKLILSK